MKNESDKYNLMFIIDDKHNDILSTVINNISKVSSDIVNNLKFNISYFGDKNSSEELLKSLSTLNLNIKLKNIPSEFAELNDSLQYHYSKTTHGPQIPTASVYYRFFLASTWPELTGKLLYLDTDILVKESLSKLFDLIPTETKYPLFSPAYPAGQISIPFAVGTKKLHRQVIKIFRKSEKIKKDYENANLDVVNHDTKRPMFNGGVWFYDLDIIRSGTYEDKMRICMEMQSLSNIFKWNDQGIMNFVFSDFYHLPPEWNSVGFGWQENTPIPYDLSKIVHYNGVLKPWSKEYPFWMNKFGAIDEWNKYKLNESI